MTDVWIEFGAFAWVSLGWVWSIHVERKDFNLTLEKLVAIGIVGAVLGPILPIVMEIIRWQYRPFATVILNRYRR